MNPAAFPELAESTVRDMNTWLIWLTSYEKPGLHGVQGHEISEQAGCTGRCDMSAVGWKVQKSRIFSWETGCCQLPELHTSGLLLCEVSV